MPAKHESSDVLALLNHMQAPGNYIVNKSPSLLGGLGSLASSALSTALEITASIVDTNAQVKQHRVNTARKLLQCNSGQDL